MVGRCISYWNRIFFEFQPFRFSGVEVISWRPGVQPRKKFPTGLCCTSLATCRSARLDFGSTSVFALRCWGGSSGRTRGGLVDKKAYQQKGTENKHWQKKPMCYYKRQCPKEPQQCLGWALGKFLEILIGRYADSSTPKWYNTEVRDEGEIEGNGLYLKVDSRIFIGFLFRPKRWEWFLLWLSTCFIYVLYFGGWFNH